MCFILSHTRVIEETWLEPESECSGQLLRVRLKKLGTPGPGGSGAWRLDSGIISSLGYSWNNPACLSPGLGRDIFRPSEFTASGRKGHSGTIIIFQLSRFKIDFWTPSIACQKGLLCLHAWLLGIKSKCFCHSNRHGKNAYHKDIRANVLSS